jgi:hypothetical protein
MWGVRALHPQSFLIEILRQEQAVVMTNPSSRHFAPRAFWPASRSNLLSGRNGINPLCPAYGRPVRCGRQAAGSGVQGRAGGGMKQPACGSKEGDLPLSRFPLRGRAGAGGFPPRRTHAARQPKALARIDAVGSPHKRAAAPLCIPRATTTVWGRAAMTLFCKADRSLINKTGQITY